MLFNREGDSVTYEDWDFPIAGPDPLMPFFKADAAAGSSAKFLASSRQPTSRPSWTPSHELGESRLLCMT
jgi:hypothetical protein